MAKLSYRCTQITTEQDFKTAQAHISGKAQLCKNFHNNLTATWQQALDYLKPGESADGVQAVEFVIVVPDLALGENPDETKKQFSSCVMQVLSNKFTKHAVLSVVYAEGPIMRCIADVIPMAGRRPDSSKCLNQIKKDQPVDKLKIEIETALHELFYDVIITGTETAADKKTIGYKEALLNFRAPLYNPYDDQIQWYRINDTDGQVQTHLPYDQIKKYTQALLLYFMAGPEIHFYERSQAPNSDITPKMFMKKVESEIHRQYPDIDAIDTRVIMNKIYKAIFENYVLEPLIDADDISDIMVLAPDHIRVKVGGNRFNTNVKFYDAEDYWRFIERLAVRNNLDLQHNAINVFSDTRSNPNFRMRLNITMPVINSDEFPVLHIRKIAKHKRDMDYLLKAGMLDETMRDYLIDRARHGKGMVFTGKGASGKTTLMNCLLDYIPFNKSGLVIQESEELFSDVHPHLMFEHIVGKMNPTGKPYDLESLARNGLLTDLDYFIIGEIKGAEAKYFMMAADTGHQCWCSVHSPSSTDAIDKLADYVMYATSYSKDDATHMLKDLGTVIFMKNFKVCEISEISGWDNEKKELIYTPVYKRPE